MASETEKIEVKEEARQETPRRGLLGGLGHRGGKGDSAQGGPAKGARGVSRPFPADPKGGRGAGRGGEEGPDRRRRLAAICCVCVGVTVASLGLGGTMLASSNALKAKMMENTVKVVTTTENVPAGTTIESDKLTVADVPGTYVASDAVKVDGDDTQAAIDKVAGRRALANLTAGTSISGSTLSGDVDPTSLSQSVERGSVAYMMSVDTAQGVAPFLKVGDKVDVYTGSGDVTPKKLLSAVTVIALDGNLTGGGTSAYTTVTLQLTDQQALDLFTEQDVAGSSVHIALTPEETLQSADASAQAALAAGQGAGQNAVTAPSAGSEATTAQAL